MKGEPADDIHLISMINCPKILIKAHFVLISVQNTILCCNFLVCSHIFEYFCISKLKILVGVLAFGARIVTCGSIWLYGI